MRISWLVISGAAAAAVSCGNDGTHHLADATIVGDACDDGAAATISITTPQSYVCHAPFTAQIEMTGASCTATTITDIKITGVVTSGNCSPPGPGTYTPEVSSVPAQGSAQILNLTAGAFCCTSPGCPADFTCTEHYTYVVDTNEGPIDGSADVTLDLDSCDEICP